MTPETFTSAEMLSRLIAFDTTTRNSNLELIAFVRDYLSAHGVTSDLIENSEGTKANLYATIGPDDPGGIVLSGHTDVVPVDGQDWSSDPFCLTERDGRFYGRGTCDMKGFVAAVLSLVPEMTAARPARPFHIALSYDEEIGCVGVRPMLEHIAANRPRPALCVVGEPTSMRVVNAHKGIRTFLTRITGLDAHSSRTQEGVSAVTAAARLIVFLEDMAERMRERGDPSGEFDPPYTTISVGDIRGGTAVNIIPRSCEFLWEYRTLPSDDDEEIITAFEDFAREQLLAPMRARHAGCSIETAHISHSPGLEPDPDARAEQVILRLANQNAVHAVAYATEAGLFQKTGIPSVVCGPGDIAQAHKPDEFVSIDQLDACEGFLRRLIAEWA